MSNIKKLLILSSTLILIGLVGSIFTFKHYNSNFFNLSFNGFSINSNNSPITTKNEEVIIKEEFLSIIANVDNAYITLSPSDDNITKVVASNIPDNSSYEFSALVSDNNLKIDLKQKSPISINILPNNTLTLAIHLPKKVYDSIKIDSSNTLIKGENISSKEIEIETSNGIINLKNIESDILDLSSSNGKITISGKVNKEIIGETSNGGFDFDLKSIDLPINLEASNGSISMKVENLPTNVTFDTDTSNGNINLFDKYPDNSVIGEGENLVKLHTSNGKITISK